MPTVQKLICGALVSALLAAYAYGENRSYWITDYDKAFELAESSGKPVLIYFTGSDWCLWCRKFDQTVFDSSICVKELPELAVPLKLDFPQRRRLAPREGRRNKAAQVRHDAEEIPTVILYDPASQKELWRHGYFDTSPDAYLAALRALAEPVGHAKD